MSDVVLLLGPIAFQDFEVPSGINFGGRQRLSIHRLPGGARVIDALGRDEALISFCGVFSGSDATLRARAIDQLRVSGMPLPLTWDILFYTVLIAEFVADYRSSWWIPYQVRCIILQDEASTLLQSAMSLGAAALADVGRAASYAPDIAIDLMPLQAALAAPAATTRGTSAFSRAQSSLNETRSLLQASIAAADTTLATTNPTTAGSVSLGVEQLAAVADASGQSSSLIAARALLQRTAANLTNAST